MRKLFTFLFAALMSVGMFAATEVTITQNDFPQNGTSFTKDGVTVSAGMIDRGYGNIMRGGSFSTNLGNFTKIEVSANDVHRMSGEGWSGDSHSKTWTGNASSVSFSGEIMGNGQGVTLKFTIEAAAPSTYTLKLVADPTMGSVAVTNLLGSDIVDNGNGTYTVPENAKVTILATPNEGYAFTGWLEGNVLCDFIDCGVALNTLDNPLTFTMTNDAACKAEFKATAPAGEVTVVFAANNKTVERTVTLPHTFWCDLGTENGELDLIIQELFALPLGGYCDAWNGPVATGNPAVTAGAGDEDDDFITISEAFEGTATVSGKYNRYTEMDEEEFNYSLTISIKAGSATAVENVQTNQVQATKILRDGMLLIEKNGKIYNVMGAEVK